MLSALKNALQLKELRDKIIFTVLMLLVFRLGVHIPVPGINLETISKLVSEGQLLGFFDVISGGAFKKFSIFAMSITPYINASIIIQLLTVVIPALERAVREDRKKMVEFTRYLTVILALIQGLGLSLGFRSALLNPTFGGVLVVALTLTAGTAFLMWLGEMINEKGIGNGISILIFAGIVSKLPAGLIALAQYLTVGTTNIIVVLLFALVSLLVIIGVIAIQEGERKLPVQYAQRVVGRKVYGGQSTHIPIKVNSAGVVPVIFAMSILMFPATLASWFPGNKFAVFMANVLDFRSIFYNVLYALLILFFTYFYSAITFNPFEVADNIKKYGGFIPGLRPGKPTSDYIGRVMNRITFFGALFLAVIAIMPALMINLTTLPLYFGGTSLLIVVGVALETMKQLESHLLMRRYEGFMK